MALGKKPIDIVNEGKHQLLVKAEHWKRIPLADVAKVQNGFAFSSVNFSKSEGVPLIRIRDIDKKTTVDKYDGAYNDDYLVNRGDILVGMDGDFNIAKWQGDQALLNQRVCRLIPYSEGYNPNFLFLCLQPYLNAINEETSSVTVKHLSSKTIEEIPLPYPNRDEQDQIVEKIEELFSELDKGIENLKTAQQQLKVYRQAVLKWAFEGKLTNEGLKEGELPDGWVLQNFEAVCHKIGDIDHKMPKTVTNGIPYVSTKDFNDDLTISFSNAKYISEKDYLMLSRKIKPEFGDIIFPRYGTIGKNILINFEKKFLVSYSCAIVKPNHKLINSKYLYLYSLSPQVHEEIRKYVVETTQANIGIASIKKFVLAFPLSLDEQLKVTQEIESRLSVCDKMEETITDSLQQAEALRQSILKRAFEGKLVSKNQPLADILI